MVMHARKTQRISDGYFEKHQAHPYQNSKYGSSKSGSYGNSSERYDRMRDSPNGNSYRSDSPDSQSPRDRDRSYQNKSSYVQKIREKERENRDYKSSRDKYSGDRFVDCVRSPKDKRSRESRDSEHRTNHDRSAADDKMLLHSMKQMVQKSSSRDRQPTHNCQDKREDRERVSRVGDWSEHISSSGKKYYYNCKTEVSQWEKPREWMERERNDRSSSSSTRGCKDRSSSSCNDLGDRNYSRSSSSIHEKHSNAPPRSSNSGRDKSGGSRSSWPPSECEPPTATESRGRRSDTTADTQDMDISPGDSTPTSEASHEPQSDAMVAPGPVLLAAALPRLTSSTSPPMVPPPTSGAPPPGQAPGPPVSTPVSLANLPRLLSQMTGHKSLESADQQTLQNIHTALLMTRSDTTPIMSSSSSIQPLKVDTSGHIITEGPPTPTHSEGQDCTDTRKLNSPPSSLSSLGALRPQGPSITPSLANHYRDDLVNHIRGWPAEALEKQTSKLIEEAHITGSLQCAKVSADLKIARSLVRLTEIQATLQEQRILFLRQQIRLLEDLKSQNSFMSDDS